MSNAQGKLRRRHDAMQAQQAAEAAQPAEVTAQTPTAPEPPAPAEQPTPATAQPVGDPPPVEDTPVLADPRRASESMPLAQSDESEADRLHAESLAARIAAMPTLTEMQARREEDRKDDGVHLRIVSARRESDPAGSVVLLLAPADAARFPGVVNMLRGQDVASVPTAGPSAEPMRAARRGRGPAKTKTVRRAVRKRAHVGRRPVAAADSKGRGRIAGRYVMGSKQPTYLTDSIEAIYKIVKTHKRGVTAKDISERLEMPMGTVGWALQTLKNSGAIKHEAA